MKSAQISTLSKLLSFTKRHESVRRDPETASALATSRRIGDEARLDMWRVRGN